MKSILLGLIITFAFFDTFLCASATLTQNHILTRIAGGGAPADGVYADPTLAEKNIGSLIVCVESKKPHKK